MMKISILIPISLLHIPSFIDRELGRFIYVREIWFMWKILRVPKMGSFKLRKILKKIVQCCSLMLWDQKFINASNFKLTLVSAVTLKRHRKISLFMRRPAQELSSYNVYYLKTTMPARFECTKLLPASPFSSAKRNVSRNN